MVVTSSVMFLLTLQEPGQQLGLADRPDAKECRPGGERHPPVWRDAGCGENTRAHTERQTQTSALKINRFLFCFLLEITLAVVCFHQDAENEKKELPFEHQTEISDKLGEAEGLLRDLFLDVDKAKKLKHPQATEIESEWVVRDKIPQRATEVYMPNEDECVKMYKSHIHTHCPQQLQYVVRDYQDVSTLKLILIFIEAYRT